MRDPLGLSTAGVSREKGIKLRMARTMGSRKIVPIPKQRENNRPLKVTYVRKASLTRDMAF